jgi:hypothetical protein
MKWLMSWFKSEVKILHKLVVIIVLRDAPNRMYFVNSPNKNEVLDARAKIESSYKDLSKVFFEISHGDVSWIIRKNDILMLQLEMKELTYKSTPWSREV